MSNERGTTSWWLPALMVVLSGVFALVGNLATNTVQVTGPWRVVVWVVTGLLLAGAAALTIVERIRSEDTSPAWPEWLQRAPEWLRRAVASPAARIGAAIVGAFALGLLLSPGWSTSSQPGAAAPSTGSDSTRRPTGEPRPSGTTARPSPTPSSTPSPPAQDPPTANPPVAPPAPAPVRVRWHGTLILGGYGGTGGGWFLDPAQPSRAVTGDVYLGNANEVAGRALVAWDGSGAPTQQRCADLLRTHLGQRYVDVQVGTMACLMTEGGRVGSFTVVGKDPNQLQPYITVDVTVWERR